MIVIHIHYDQTGILSNFRMPSISSAMRRRANTNSTSFETSLHNNFSPKINPEWLVSSLHRIRMETTWPIQTALDYVQDRNFFIIDSMSHLPNHIDGMVHIGPQNLFIWLWFLFLWGFSMENVLWQNILMPWGIGDFWCVHSNKKACEELAKRIQDLRKDRENVESVMSHKLGWEEISWNFA